MRASCEQRAGRPTPGTRRRDDWPERLSELVEARRYESFAWGAHDCALFAADAVALVTGSDPAKPWRGRYLTETEAEALIAGDLGELAAGALGAIGAVACEPVFAQRGDVALVQVGNMRCLGVVLGDHVAVPGPDALAFVPRRSALRAWAI